MKSLLFLLFFAVAKQNFVSADDSIQNVVKHFLDQINEIKRRVENIMQFDKNIQNNLPTILNEKVSIEFEKHPVVLQAQIYMNKSKEGKYYSEECQTLFDLKYNSSKTTIYKKLFEKIDGYYSEIKEILTTRFEEELKEFERRVNELHKSPKDADFLTTKMNGALKVIYAIEIAQNNIIKTTLHYFKEEDSTRLIYDNLLVPFTECLQNTYRNKF